MVKADANDPRQVESNGVYTAKFRTPAPLLPVPFWGNEAGSFFESGSASEINWIVRGYSGIRVEPLRVVATVIGAVELIVRIHPAAENH